MRTIGGTVCILWVCVGLLVACCTTPTSAQEQPPAQPPVDGAVDKAAQDLVNQILKKGLIEPPATIAVDAITDPPENSGGNGAEIQRALADALIAKGFMIDNKAYEIRLTGESTNGIIGEDKAQGLVGQPVQKVEIRAKDRANNPMGIYVTIVNGVEAVPRARGITMEIGALADDNTRATAILNASEKPAPPPEGTLVKTSAESPFAIELLVEGAAGKFQAVKPQLLDGQVFADIEDGRQIRIVLINNSDKEVAAAVSIDGLSMFEFAAKKPAPQYCIVKHKSRMEIPGWFIKPAEESSQGEVRAFVKVNDFAKTARAGLGLKVNDEYGLIHVAFCPCSSEPFKGSRGIAPGPPLKIDAKLVDRYVGNPIAYLTVRYERKAK